MVRLGVLRDLGLALLGLLLLIAPFVLTVSARGAEALAGPVPALVTRVVDGDTLEARVRIWIGQELTTKVRLAEINAPEIGSHAKCAAERRKGEEARVFLAGLVAGRAVQLYDIRFDKYGDRVDARVVLAGNAGGEEIDVGDLLVAKGFAVAYGSLGVWCAR